MRKLYISFTVAFLILSFAGMFAQAPTIVQADLPSIGYTYNNVSDTTPAERVTFTVTPGSSSAQNWNYAAGWITTYNEPINFVTPSSGQNYTSFPGATMGALNAGQWAYFTSNASGFSLNGGMQVLQGNTVTVVFTPNEMLVPVPFTYNTNYTNAYSATFTMVVSSQTVQVRHYASQTITGDAFGSLTTPGGTYPNTVREKNHTTTIDSVFIYLFSSWSFYQAQYDTTTDYTWLQNNSTMELMAISINKAGVTTKAQYLQNFSNQVPSVNSLRTSLEIYPNPVSDFATINFDNGAGGPVQVSLFDLSGKELATLFNGEQPGGKQRLAINLSSLQFPKGLYFTKIRTYEGIQTSKFVLD